VVTSTLSVRGEQESQDSRRLRAYRPKHIGEVFDAEFIGLAMIKIRIDFEAPAFAVYFYLSAGCGIRLVPLKSAVDRSSRLGGAEILSRGTRRLVHARQQSCSAAQRKEATKSCTSA